MTYGDLLETLEQHYLDLLQSEDYELDAYVTPQSKIYLRLKALVDGIIDPEYEEIEDE